MIVNNVLLITLTNINANDSGSYPSMYINKC